MKKFFFTFWVLSLSLGLMAQTLDGLTCETAIPVDTSFTGSVPAPGVYYYSAWTYDLPLACYFYPEDDELSTLYFDVDFTCTPGVYDDPKIEDLLNTTIGWGIDMPIRFDKFEKGIDENGRTYYTMSIQETYRELMANFGVSYDVQALIKVTTSSAGDIHMAPDTTFKACVENSIWLNLPDTALTGVMNSDNSYVLPMSDWQNDSIRFRWTGTQAPVQVWIGDKCGFDLALTGPNCAVDYFQLQPDAGNGENIYEMSRQMIWDMIDLLEKGGIYYVRVISTEEAELIVEKQPIDGPLASAIELELDVPAKVAAQDSEQVYYFPTDWKARSVEFVSSVATPITAYVSHSLEFEAHIADANVIGVYDFVVSSTDGRWQMSLKEMENLCGNLSDELVFVKFIAEQPTVITPLRWNVCECAQKSTEIYPTDSVRIKAKASSVSYRINYAQWSKRDVKLYWNSVADMKAYLADTCGGFNLRPTNQHVLLYKEYLVDNLGFTDTLTITAEEMQTFASRVDEDGYLYFRFNANSYGDLLVSSVLSGNITPDPIYTYDSATVCFGETYDWNGKTYTETGKYTYTTVAANGADSIVTLTLTVHPQTEATTDSIEIPFGETYEWHGVVYAESGEYTITLQDENGCDYQATLLLTVEEKPVSPCVAASTLLEPVAELTLNLGNAFDIYRIDYQAWLASGVNLVWTGKGVLHTFVAKDCEFAVAIYHKDVVNYTEVPAEGNVVLSKDILAPLAQYVDADGYLYVRFLTELEGQLTTALAE